MSLRKGDHLVIKRNGVILTPDYGEGYHEFEVMESSTLELYEVEHSEYEPSHKYGYTVRINVVR